MLFKLEKCSKCDIIPRVYFDQYEGYYFKCPSCSFQIDPILYNLNELVIQWNSVQNIFKMFYEEKTRI